MRILALNAGSSSLKFRVADATGSATTVLAGGAVEGIGSEPVLWTERDGTRSTPAPVEAATPGAAAEPVLSWLADQGIFDATVGGAVGFRIVHGGDRFTEPTVLGEAALDAIGDLRELAPLHNGPALDVVDEVKDRLPDLPLVAVFDTDFHRTMPPSARVYAIPTDLAEAHGLHRFGFHGLAHRSMAEQHAALTGRADHKLVTLQLGNGCSAAAIDAGRSIETSMGLTPTEGLVMGTRSGDVDPTLVVHLAERADLSVAEAAGILDRRSGLAGLSGIGADMKHLLDQAHQVDDADRPAAQLAIEVFCRRATHYVGAYLALLGGADAVVFGGGIGERSSEIRRRICEPLRWAGLALDGDRNDTAAGDAPERISADGASLEAWVVPVDEEAVIVDDTRRVLEPTTS